MLFAWSVLHPCKTLGKQLKHACFRRSPNASLRSFLGFASCKTSVRTLSSILAWSQGASLSALRLIFKSFAFEPPIISPARMPGVYAKRLCTMQSPPSIHNPSPRGRGLGMGIENLLNFIKYRLFRQAEPPFWAALISF